jgi:hypothetical protein
MARARDGRPSASSTREAEKALRVTSLRLHATSWPRSGRPKFSIQASGGSGHPSIDDTRGSSTADSM